MRPFREAVALFLGGLSLMTVPLGTFILILGCSGRLTDTDSQQDLWIGLIGAGICISPLLALLFWIRAWWGKWRD
jgi:hypothetical protein